MDGNSPVMDPDNSMTQTGPLLLCEAVKQVLVGLDDPRRQEEAQRREEWERKREERLQKEIAEQEAKHLEERRERFWDTRGRRYAACTLDNFQATTPAHQAVLAAVRRYAASLKENIKAGVNLILIGGPGTGKDHLLSALFDPTISMGARVAWTSGAELFRELRDMISVKGPEGRVIEGYQEPHVFAISDPCPAVGSLTPYQSDALYQILDHRYNRCKVVWATINAQNRADADERIGAKLVDRLVDGAVSLACDWPSYRKARD